MADATVEVIVKKDLGKLINGLVGPMKADAVRALQETAIQGVAVVVGNIDSPSGLLPAPVNTGQLRQSVRYKRLADGGAIVVDAPHAPFMEYGTRPHTPPLGPLRLWAVRRLGVDEKTSWAVARGVQKAIALKGIEPRFFMKRSLPKLQELALKNVRAAVAKRSSK